MRPSLRSLLLLGSLIVAPACRDDAPAAPAPGGTAPAPVPVGNADAPCTLLTADQVREVTGQGVTASKGGNPQSCVEFRGDRFFLGVWHETGGYERFVDSLPPEMRTHRRDDLGLGDRAVMFAHGDSPDASGYLVIEKGGKVVVLDGFGFTGAQELELAKRAVAAL